MQNKAGEAYIAMIDRACATATEWRLGDFNTAAARFFIGSLIFDAMHLGDGRQEAADYQTAMLEAVREINRLYSAPGDQAWRFASRAQDILLRALKKYDQTPEIDIPTEARNAE